MKWNSSVIAVQLSWANDFEGERKHNKELIEVQGDGASRLWAGAFKSVKITSKDVSTR